MIKFFLSISGHPFHRRELHAQTADEALASVNALGLIPFADDYLRISFRDTSSLAPTFGLDYTIYGRRGADRAWRPVPEGMDALKRTVEARKQDGGTFTGPSAELLPVARRAGVYAWRDEVSRHG